MQYNKIKFLNNAHNISLVTKGYSGDEKYTFIKNNKTFFLKITKKKINNDLENILSKGNIPHPRIVEIGSFDEFYYIIEEYIETDNLKENLCKYEPKFIYEQGFKIGKKYSNLRSIYKDKRVDRYVISAYREEILDKINKLENLIKNIKLNENAKDFMAFTTCYLQKKFHFIKNSLIVYGHTDIKPSNFLISDDLIYAIDIEDTDYVEIARALMWSYARSDHEFDEKNFSFAKGYLDGLFSFAIPKEVFLSMDYTYMFNMVNIFIEYLENDEINRLYNKIDFIKNNYIKSGKVIISKIIKNIVNVEGISLIKNATIDLVSNSFDPNNLTFKVTKNGKRFFFKMMQINSTKYTKIKKTYKLLKKLNIPSPKTLKCGRLKKNLYYVVFEFVNLPNMATFLINSFENGVKYGQTVASYMIKLKNCQLDKANTFNNCDLDKQMKKMIDFIYGDKEENIFIKWSKSKLLNTINNYIESFNDEPINLIHGDIKFDNILFGENNIFFVDNESFLYSYDVINFRYSLFLAFDNKAALEFKGFINGYLKYMNDGKIPSRITQQIKILLLNHILEKVLDMKKSNDYNGIENINDLLDYCLGNRSIEWLN